METIPGTRLPVTNGTPLALPDNSVTSAFSLGFTTRFFAQPTDLFWVGSNGFITLHFLTPDGCCEGAPLPTAGGPDGIIAGWWTDLDPSLGGTIQFAHPTLDGQRALIVDYDQVRVRGTTDTATFQVVLFESGVFEIRIEDASTPVGRFASVGAENINGQRGIEQMRVNGTRVTATGFRFTPNVPTGPPPIITSVTPSTVTAGSFVQVTGDNFLEGALVLVGGRTASTFFQNATVLGFSAPFLSGGTFDVTVRNPDGNQTTAPGALTILDSLSLSFVSPSIARQGDTIFVTGSGFDQDTILFLDDTPIETDILDSGLMRVQLPPAFRPGRYDAEVLDTESFANAKLFGALLVLGRPDARIDETRITRPTVSTFATPGVPLPTPWTVEVDVTNAGDLTARGVVVEVEAAPTSGIGSVRRATMDLPDLSPGEAARATLQVGTGAEVGDHAFIITVTTTGVADRAPDNNVETRTVGAYVQGVPGASVDPCAAIPRACQFPETRHHVREARDQSDSHAEATLGLSAIMRQADFDFANFPLVFTRSELLPEGGFTECTTWRFRGGADGTFRVTMTLANGLEGQADAPTAASRASNGTKSSIEWSDQRAFGVILTETPRSETESEPSDALESYRFEKGESEWDLRATGLTGDFTHCAIRAAGSPPREEFTFAALPSDPDAPIASFEGQGTAQSVVVSFHGFVEHGSSGPFL